MPKILFQPAGGEASRGRYERTVKQPVSLQGIRDVLKSDELGDLERISSDAVRLWGLTSGTKKAWSDLEPGDIVVFTGQGHAFASGVVAAKIQNSAVAMRLWGKTDDGNNTWEYIYALEEKLRSHAIPYSKLNEVADRNYQHRGATLLRSESQVERVLRLLGHAHTSENEAPGPPMALKDQNLPITGEAQRGPPLPPPDNNQLDDATVQLQQRLEIDARIIRSIVAHLLAGRHVILVGPTGSGKTELACQISKAVFGIDAHVVTATADWTAYEVIGGPFPIVDSVEGRPFQSFVIRPGCVYEALKLDSQRGNNGESGTWLVIDELNRAEVDKAFGELFTALEQGTLRVPRIVSSEADSATELITIPERFRIIGTMNSADRHYLFRLSDALKRRFAFVWLGLPEDPEAERKKVIRRVRENLEKRNLFDDAIPLEAMTIAMYELLGFMRLFYPVGVAQAIAALEYASVRSTLGDASQEECLEGGLLANVIPQFEGISSRQLHLLTNFAAGEPDQAIEALAVDVEAEPTGPFYDAAGLHDLQKIVRYFAQRCTTEGARTRTAEIDTLLTEQADSAERQQTLRELLIGTDDRASLAALVSEEDFGLPLLPEVARRIGELAADADGGA